MPVESPGFYCQEEAEPGEASDLPPAVLQRYLDATAAGRFSPPIHQIYEGLEQVAEAHRSMEANKALGKLVVRVRHPS